MRLLSHCIRRGLSVYSLPSSLSSSLLSRSHPALLLPQRVAVSPSTSSPIHCFRLFSSSSNSPPLNQPKEPSGSTSSSSSSSADPDVPHSFLDRLALKIPRLQSLMVFTGVFLGGLLVVRLGTDIVVFFSKLNILSVAESAYIAGLVSGATLALVGMGGLRAWKIRPDAVQAIAMKKVLSDVRIKHILGANVKTAAFKAYSYVPGHIRWSAQDRAQARLAMELHRASNEYSDLKATADQEKAKHSAMKKLFNERFLLWYKPKSLQLFFQLNSPDNSAHAMVSAEVEKTFRGEYVWNVLSVDFMETGDRIVIEGDPDIVLYRGVIKLR